MAVLRISVEWFTRDDAEGARRLYWPAVYEVGTFEMARFEEEFTMHYK